MNKNEFCDSYCLIGQESSPTTKLSLTRHTWPSPASEPLAYAHRSYPSHDKTQLFVPTFSPFKSRNLVIAAKGCVFVPADLKLLLQSRKFILFAWVLFFSLLWHLLSHKGIRISFIHSFTLRVARSQVYKGDKWWGVRIQVWELCPSPLLSLGVYDQEGWTQQKAGWKMKCHFIKSWKRPKSSSDINDASWFLSSPTISTTLYSFLGRLAEKSGVC